MTHRIALALVALAVISAGPAAAPALAQSQPQPTVQMPQPGVPEIFTLEGAYVRVAYNNEGYAILGYRLANASVGTEWMLLDFGTTLLGKTPNFTLKREALSLDTPDGKTIPLATIQEYRGSNEIRALENRARVTKDSINYFPPVATRGCRIGFFSQVDQRAMPWDEVELSNDRACLGRLFFKVPGGIAYGQHFLNVKFAGSVIRVPFRILTKEEEKLLSKNYKNIKKAVDDAFRPPKK